VDERILAQTIAEELGTVAAALVGVEPAVRAAAPATSSVWSVKFAVHGPFEGTAALLMAADDAARLTSLVLGFDDGPPDDAVMDNLQEIAKQIAGSLNVRPESENILLSADEPAARLGSAPPGAAWVDVVIGDLTVRAGVSTALVATRGAGRAPAPAPAASAKPAPRPEPPASPAVPSNLDLILDMELPLWVRFGWTNMTLQALSKLGPGMTLDLERMTDDPVEVLVNDIVVARGEVVVVSGNYGVRVTEVVSAQDRIRSMGPAN